MGYNGLGFLLLTDESKKKLSNKDIPHNNFEILSRLKFKQLQSMRVF